MGVTHPEPPSLPLVTCGTLETKLIPQNATVTTQRGCHLLLSLIQGTRDPGQNDEEETVRPQHVGIPNPWTSPALGQIGTGRELLRRLCWHLTLWAWREGRPSGFHHSGGACFGESGPGPAPGSASAQLCCLWGQTSPEDRAAWASARKPRDYGTWLLIGPTWAAFNLVSAHIFN